MSEEEWGEGDDESQRRDDEIRAAERERCAKVAEGYSDSTLNHAALLATRMIAAAIRGLK